MQQFELKMLPWNLVFGAGCIESLPEYLADFGFARAVVLATPEQRTDAEQIAARIGARAAGIFAEARMHVPIETAEAARAYASEVKADCSISIGGGSTTGLGKALALAPGLPQIAIPTTYAGSEMTNIWGMTQDGRKQTGRDLKVLPVLTLYDAKVTINLPTAMSGVSAMNAMAQAVINAKDPRTSPVIRIMALEAISALASGLPGVMANPQDLAAREQLLYGASLAGAALGAGVTSLHHRLCHTLGGSFNTPHAETHTILLPYSVAYAAPAVPAQMEKIAAALGVDNAAAGLHDLGHKHGLPSSLEAIGIKAADLPRIAELATETAVENPRPVTTAGVLKLLQAAHSGAAPTEDVINHD